MRVSGLSGQEYSQAWPSLPVNSTKLVSSDLFEGVFKNQRRVLRGAFLFVFLFCKNSTTLTDGRHARPGAALALPLLSADINIRVLHAHDAHRLAAIPSAA